MKQVLFISALFFSLSRLSAQPLADVGTYLANSKVYEGAKQYYRDEITTSVNDTTNRIVDSLDSKNNSTRPFYLLQVSKMLRFADAALANALFSRCYDMLQKRPNELITFLYCNNNYVLAEYKTYWATAVSWQLRKEATDDPKVYLAKVQENLAKKCKKQNEANFKAFFTLVSERM